MKKTMLVIMCLSVLLAMAGCGSDEGEKKSGSNSSSVTDVIESGINEQDSGNSGNDEKPADSSQSSQLPPETPSDSEADKPTVEIPTKVDIDLTDLSTTMVYSEVYNMNVNPKDYMNKLVKIKGLFDYFYDEAGDKYYFACVVLDATACCAQGLEFIPVDAYSYPADYPEVEDEICVIGRFSTYKEGSVTYCTLKDAVFVTE